jgi:hypothetical protein
MTARFLCDIAPAFTAQSACSEEQRRMMEGRTNNKDPLQYPHETIIVGQCAGN